MERIGDVGGERESSLRATRKGRSGCIQRTASCLEVADEATESFKWTTSLEVLLLTAYGHV